MSRDLDGYYVLTYQPSQATDGRFHPIAVRTTRKDAQIRVPSGYWSPLSSEWRTWLDRSSAPPGPSAPVRALRRSRLIDTWYGFERGDDGRLEFVFTWEPTPAGTALRSQPRVVVLKVSTPQGTALFERELHAVAPPGRGGADDRALFAVPTGRHAAGYERARRGRDRARHGRSGRGRAGHARHGPGAPAAADREGENGP